ncbi:MAG: hypothetical protein ACLQVJ_07975 [Syntrophobacteraceae bacterium]
MYYAFNKYCEGWKPRRRQLLADRLLELVFELPLDGWGMRPYVRTNPGFVAIRRLTHYPEEQYREIVKAADRIYDEVMEIGDFAPQPKPQRLRVVKKKGPS